jgi:hypothetical protein
VRGVLSLVEGQHPMRHRPLPLPVVGPLLALAGPAGALGIALAVLLVTFPAPASAVIFYEVGVGYRQPEFFLFHQDTVPRSIDTPIGGCPAPGTADGLCGHLRSEAGNNGGRLFLRSGARFKRTNVDPMHGESAAYADTKITITAMGGYVGTAPLAAFYFGLGGTLSTAATDPNVLLQAFASATLQAGSGGGVQCFGETDCLPKPDPYKVMVTDWTPSQGFVLRLRSDVAAVAPFGTPGGWDAEVVADFADTLEVLAIQLLDENGDPIPGVTLTALDGNGDPLVTFPNEPPTVPEPAQVLLVLTGGLVLAAAARRRRRA